MSAGIFISYRRQDSIAQARAVFERLSREFGTASVFIDLEGLDYGEDFVVSLERQLAQCRVLLALIGPQWLHAQDGRGRRRLDLRNDFVRIELRTALERPGVRVVPVLIDGADMPDDSELPDDLHPLLRRHALTLRFANFDADMRELVGSLRKLLATPAASVAQVSAAPVAPEAATAPVPAPAPTVPETAVQREHPEHKPALAVSDKPAEQPLQAEPLHPASPARLSAAAAGPDPSALISKRALLVGGGAAAILGGGWLLGSGRKESPPPPAPSPAPSPVPSPTPAPAARPNPSWQSGQGNDNFGRWAEFTVKGITQRLRWISPGEFWMGSPTTEKERDNDEHLHRVKLSQGFWMADSACTQALWQAVVGDNPSHFTGDPQRPVERVSWNDVQQRFLPALANLVGGLKAALPTEAQWEYACRAGTETPFSFGQQISTAQANYNGNFPYADGPKGEYREKTVAVKSLPANAWGLHEMHGNVWEWCADGYGPYGEASAVDPVGPPNAASRVARGGSWSLNAWYLRAACRYHFPPDLRVNRLGFRLCVVSPIE